MSAAGVPSEHMRGVVVIGVGNPFRGDDGAGIEAARLLRDRLPPEIDVLEQDGDPVALLDAWHGARVAFVIDAVRSLDPGEVHRVEIGFHGEARVPPSPRRDSSHALGLGEAVQLARVLDRLPGRLVLIGIAGRFFGTGDELSGPVRRAVDSVVEALVGEVAAACA